MASVWSQYRWTVLRSLPVGVILPLSFFLGSVGPDDFSRNYAGWAKTFGLTDWASWLARYATGPRVFWAVVLVTFVYLAVGFGIPALVGKLKKDAAIVMVPVSVALIIVVGSFFAYKMIAVPTQRHLTAEQKERLSSALLPLPKIEIYVYAATAEEARYAIDFIEVLKKAGYTTLGPFTGYGETENDRGVMVGMLDPKNPSPEATNFFNALEKAGVYPTTTKWLSPIGTSGYDLFIGPP